MHPLLSKQGVQLYCEPTKIANRAVETGFPRYIVRIIAVHWTWLTRLLCPIPRCLQYLQDDCKPFVGAATCNPRTAAQVASHTTTFRAYALTRLRAHGLRIGSGPDPTRSLSPTLAKKLQGVEVQSGCGMGFGLANQNVGVACWAWSDNACRRHTLKDPRT